MLNVVCGDRDTGRALVSHPTASMVSITGSTRAGYEVAMAAAKDVKRVQLELGGKAPAIVFDDADIPARRGGDRGRRIYQRRSELHRRDPGAGGSGAADEFAATLAAQAASTHTGPPVADRRPTAR